MERKLFSIAFAFALVLSATYGIGEVSSAPAPALPFADITTVPVAQAAAVPSAPIRLQIPSLGLDSRVIKVGVDKKGAMDVPSGSTSQVGWYAPGTTPGQLGSAVFAAHVYAAFKKLGKASLGDDILVTGEDGVVRRFVVIEKKTYPLASVPAQALFNRADGKRINLITCAGVWSTKLQTYTHRTVVYAVLAA